MKDDTLSGVLVISKRTNTPIIDMGAAEMITSAGRNARKLNYQYSEYRRKCKSQDKHQIAK
jgi:hypothetical protein